MKLLRFALLTIAISGGPFYPFSLLDAANLDAAVQNPNLQAVFRERLIRLRSFTDNYGRKRYRGNLSILEMQVNSAARSFLEGLEQDLSSLERSMKDVEMLAGTLRLERRGKSANASWKNSLDRLRESAENLRGSLKSVINGFSENEPLNAAALGTQWASRPRRQVIDWMDASVASISSEISDYFLTPNHTVSLSDLREASLLVKLDRVAKIAQYLKEHS